ncbi:complex I NDUFA9 subunit family protein [Sphingomonas solaris]|uniref:Complex I NDUFA9 subunit family protein n=1 Tax=Alterirhizorhabdus solaris TaxID=2529389 RepID=A0A558R3Y7_9SPHN|nr:complex I NDUFA9 subunit family protein [Sphingomonas solaris]TVV74095.1 complex I NDUFA9 subunit family protein [Sphingomonas solaris]
MDRLVTLFGGGGFLGRYVAQELLRGGARIRVVERDPRKAWFLKPLGGLGQTQFAAADITDAHGVARAIAGSDAVVNLVGILKGRFERIHVQGARNVAEAAAATGAGALVQISAIGADAESPSAYGRSKGEGEAAVRAAFPTATIVRPSILFGPEDQFVNRFAGLAQKLPVLPVIRGTAKFQPAFVADAARAIAAAALDPATHGGNTYELGGPQVITMRELNEWISTTIGRAPSIVDIPDEMSRLMTKVGGGLWGAPMTFDQWLMLSRDNVVAPGAHGVEAFGIAPTPLATVAPRWLVRYRRHGRFAKAAHPVA